MFFVKQSRAALFVLLSLLFLQGEARGENFQRAERAYSEGRFVEARDAFRELVRKNGWESGELLYNWANSELSLGENARALALYRRAALLLPRDRDVQEGLRLARARVGSRPTALSEQGWWGRFSPRHSLSLKEREWFLLGGVVLTSLLATLRLFWKREVLWLFLGSSGVTLWLLVDVVFGARDALGNPALRWSGEYFPAVLLGKTTLLQAPSETAERGEKLPGGTEALLWMPGGEWVKVLGGEEGWLRLPASELEASERIVVLWEDV